MAEGFGESAREGFLRVEPAVESEVDDTDVRLGDQPSQRGFETTPQTYDMTLSPWRRVKPRANRDGE